MVNSYRFPKRYPLHHAVKQGKVSEILNLLKYKGVSPYNYDNQTRLPLQYAICSRKPQRQFIIQLLCKYMGTPRNGTRIFLNVTKCDPVSLFIIVKQFGPCLKCLPDIIQTTYYFLHRRKDEHLKVLLNWYPLIYDEYWKLFVIGADYGFMDYCKRLVDKLKTKSYEGVNHLFLYNQTFLHYTCLIGNYDLANYLLQQGANPNIISSRFSYPLHYAISRGEQQLITLLLNHGANVYYIQYYIEKTFTIGHEKLIQRMITSDTITVDELLMCLHYSSCGKQQQTIEQRLQSSILKLKLPLDIIHCNIIPYLVVESTNP